MHPPIVLVAGRHRYAACLKLKHKTINCIVENEESPAVEQWRALAEIDENLIRLNLTPAKRAKLVKRRKAAYEAVHPETKHGKAPQKTGKGNGKGKAPKTKDLKSGSLVAPAFSDDTARTTGRSKSSVESDVTRANALGDDLDRIEGTSLDKGTELDALAKLTPNERGPIIDRAVNGENVSALRGVGAVEPKAAEQATATRHAAVKAKTAKAKSPPRGGGSVSNPPHDPTQPKLGEFKDANGVIKSACDFNPEDPIDVAEEYDTQEQIDHRIFMYRATEATRLAHDSAFKTITINDEIVSATLQAAEAWSEVASEIQRRAEGKTPKPVPDVKQAADRAEQAAAGAQVSQELIEARKEIERLREEITALKASTRDDEGRRRPPPLPRTPEEWAAALLAADENRKAKRAGARLAARAVASALSAEDEATLQEKLQKAERLLAANKTRINNLTGQLRYLRHWYAKEDPVIMSLETFGKVSRCLRQDHGPPTEAERDDALKLLNLWRSEQKKTGGLFSASDADAMEAGT